MNPAEAFTVFAAPINNHDSKAIAALMTADHVFVDGLANRMEGATVMEAGWRGYFAMCPEPSTVWRGERRPGML